MMARQLAPCHHVEASLPRQGKRTVSLSVKSNCDLSLIGRFFCPDGVFALRNDRLKLLLRISREFGDIGAFHFGPRLVPLINSPDLVRCVLVDQSAMFEKTATVRKLAAPVLGNGVFLSEGSASMAARNLVISLLKVRSFFNDVNRIQTLKIQ